jgi:hypothetical protein
VSKLLCNIPVSQAAAYADRPCVLRSSDPAELVAACGAGGAGNVVSLELLGLEAPVDALLHQQETPPIDLVVCDPAATYARLYQCAPLLATRPVRVSVPLLAGCSKAVMLAASLGFTVRLEGGQPDEAVVAELHRVADAYLHQTTFAEPVEYFHSLLLSFYREVPACLWAIQEEDPRHYRYVTDEAQETISRRFLGADLGGHHLATFPRDFARELLAEGRECARCEFQPRCAGYFKWPRRDYDCAGVRGLFQVLQEAAEQLRDDVAAAEAAA